MRNCKSTAAILALSAGMLLAATELASAQKAKKMTYEQAFEKCKATDMTGVAAEAATSAARYTRGAACMKKYGYRLKR